jgi:predicted TIM-barrel fold metal-dependent hydrolase
MKKIVSSRLKNKRTMKKSTTSRREALKQIGLISAAGTTAVFGLSRCSRESFLAELRKRIDSMPMVDSHEHLQDEHVRLSNNKNCIRLFQHYLGDDFASAGLNSDSVFGKEAEKEEPVTLWRRLEPFWHAVKNTGYGQAFRITVKELYGIDTIEERIIPQLQQEFEKLAVPGFYEKILRGHCNLESCQVDQGPFTETVQPTLLLQDINFMGFQQGAVSTGLIQRVGIEEIKDLNGYHDFLRRWFQKYAPYATATKNQIAYNRGLDFEKVPAEMAEGAFKKRVENTPLNPEEAKQLQDHLFWFCVGLADEHNLPVKLHLGYYAGSNRMPVTRVEKNVGQAADLCLRSPQTRFVFMHTAYPYGQDLISVAKQFTNAHVQTCWAWIIDPIGTKDFLKRYLVTAPSNKIHTFGGDYNVIENVVGHARLARNGVYAALAELVEEGYVGQDDALELVEPLMRENGRRIFNLEEKYKVARNVPWSTTN